MKRNNFFYKSDGLLKRINLDEIVFIEAIDKFVKFRSPDHQIMVRGQLEAIVELVQEAGFVQVHRKFAVALNQIAEISADSIRLISMPAYELPLSKRYASDLKNSITIIEGNKLNDEPGENPG